MQGIEENTHTTSVWYEMDEKTAIKVGFLACCFIGFLGFSLFANALIELDMGYYYQNIQDLKPLLYSVDDAHFALSIPAFLIGVFASMGAIAGLVAFACHKDSKGHEVIKTVIYGIALAAIGLFLGMAITGSIVHTDSWYELKKIEPLQLRDNAEDLETFGLAATPIAGIAFGGLVLGTNIVDQFAKWCHRRLQRKQAEQAEGVNLNSAPQERRSCRV